MQGVAARGCLRGVGLVPGPLRAPPQGGGVSPGTELSLSFCSFCLLCWLASKSSWPRTMLLNRDWNVRNPCTVFVPRLISAANMCSAWQPWVQLGLTVPLSSCAFQTVLFPSLLSDDPSGYSGGLEVPLPFLWVLWGFYACLLCFVAIPPSHTVQTLLL